jgi:hypothetical protein
MAEMAALLRRRWPRSGSLCPRRSPQQSHQGWWTSLFRKLCSPVSESPAPKHIIQRPLESVPFDQIRQPIQRRLTPASFGKSAAKKLGYPVCLTATTVIPKALP